MSDEALGMGSPQILSIAKSLSDHFQVKATLLCPSPIDKLSVKFEEDNVEILDVGITSRSRVAFINAVARIAAKASPDVLVIVSNLGLPILARLEKKPKLVISYMLESFYFSTASILDPDLAVLRKLKDLIDLFIFPEFERAAQVVKAVGIPSNRILVLYNSKHYVNTPARLPATSRNGRVLYQGSIFYDEPPWLHLYEQPESDIGIDIYGILRTKTKDKSFEVKFDKFVSQRSSARYLGKVSEIELDAIRPSYTYMLVYWFPNTFGQLNACPNKFYEAIANGVPPIVSPNPQIAEIVRRYECGILLRDWSSQALAEGLDYARSLIGAPGYSELVENCERAHWAELCWEKQFRKVRRFLNGENLLEREAQVVN